MHASRSRHAFDADALRSVLDRVAKFSQRITLHVCDGYSECLVEFAESGVRFASFGERGPSRLLRLLVNSGLVAQDELQDAVSAAKETGRPLRAVLVDRGADAERFDALVDRCTRDAVFELALWKHAEYAIYQELAPPEVDARLDRAIPAPLDSPTLAREAVEWSHRWDELESILSGDDARLKWLKGPARDDDSESVRLTIDGIVRQGGRCELRALWLSSDADLPSICDAVAELVTDGRIAIKRAPRFWRLSSGERPNTQILLDGNSRTFLWREHVHDRLAELHARTGKTASASRELREAAEIYLTRDEPKRALKRLERVLDLQPTDVAATELVVDAYFQLDRTDDAISFVSAHAERLSKHGDFDAARQVEALLRTLDEPVPARDAPGFDFDIPAWPSPPQPSQQVAGQRPVRSTSSRTTATLAAVVESEPSGEGATDETRPARGSRFASKFSVSTLVGTAVCVLLGALLIAGLLTLAFDKLEEGAFAAPRTAKTPADAERSTSGAGRATVDSQRSPPSATAPRAAPVVSAPQVRRRLLDNERYALFSSSGPLEVFTRLTDKRVVRLPGREGASWSIGRHGEAICNWQPRSRPIVYTLPARQPVRLSWRVPADTSALAVGGERFAIRRGSHTILLRPDGKAVHGDALPLWTEGVFAGDRLVLSRAGTEAGEATRIWIVDASKLTLLWSCTVEAGEASVH